MNLTNIKSYLFNLFVALSLLINAIFGGEMYESACAKAWRMRDEPGINGKWARLTVWFMNLFEKDHCRKSDVAFRRITCGLQGSTTGD